MKYVIILFLFITSSAQAMVADEEHAHTEEADFVINLVGLAGQVYPPIKVFKELTQDKLYFLISNHTGLPPYGFKLVIGDEPLQDRFAKVDLSKVKDLTLVKTKDLDLFNKIFDCKVSWIDTSRTSNRYGNLAVEVYAQDELPLVSIRFWIDISESSSLPDPFKGDLDGFPVCGFRFQIKEYLDNHEQIFGFGNTLSEQNFSLDYLIYLTEVNRYVGAHKTEFSQNGRFHSGLILKTFFDTPRNEEDIARREEVKNAVLRDIRIRYRFDIDPNLVP